MFQIQNLCYDAVSESCFNVHERIYVLIVVCTCVPTHRMFQFVNVSSDVLVNVRIRTRQHISRRTHPAHISTVQLHVIYVRKHVTIRVHPFDEHARPIASVFQRVCSGERRRRVPTHRRPFQATSRACAQGQPSFPLDLPDYSLPDPLTTTKTTTLTAKSRASHVQRESPYRDGWTESGCRRAALAGGRAGGGDRGIR